MHRQPYLLIIALLACLLTSCYKDEINDSDIYVNLADPEKVYISKVSGEVNDAFGNPITNVRIVIADKETLTDDNGAFDLRDVQFAKSKQGVYLKATKNGYYDTGARLYPNNGLKIETAITMVENGESFSTVSSGDINYRHASGLTLSAQPNSFLKHGKEYDGEVIINVHWVNPNDINTYTHKVQVYDAKSEDGLTKPSLASTAYITVTDGVGVPLEVKPEQPVIVHFPTQRLSTSAEPELLGAELTLLSLDETEGLWQEEGIATQTAEGYRAELKHFSWWSVANVNASVELCVTFTTEIAETTGHFYTMKTTDGSIVSSGMVSYEGETCLPIPSGKELEITVYSACLVPIGSYTYQGSTEETNSVTYDAEDASKGYTIRGTIDNCLDTPAEDSVQILYSTVSSLDYLGYVQDSFTINLSECFSHDVLYIVANQNDRTIASGQIDITPGQHDYTIHLNACNTSADDGTIVINNKVFGAAVGRKNKEETLLLSYQEDISPLIIGIDGFDTGVYEGRVIEGGQQCEGTITITEYGDVGGYIAGEFDIPADNELCKGMKGTFRVVREK